MLRGAGVEAVQSEHFCSRQQPKAGLFHDQVQIAGLAADGAVAVDDRQDRRGEHFEAHGAAVAAAAVGYISGWSIQASAAEPTTSVAKSATRP